MEDANDFSTIEIDKIFDQLANELKLKSSVNENENSEIKIAKVGDAKCERRKTGCILCNNSSYNSL